MGAKVGRRLSWNTACFKTFDLPGLEARRDLKARPGAFLKLE
jgi:hypothetical protein